MTENELVNMVIKNTDGYLCFPFNRPGTQSTITWSVIKHHHNDKILAMVYMKGEELMINVKLLPEQNESLRLLKGVKPGYHMNKKYWTTIFVNNTALSLTELQKIIEESSRLTG